MPLFLVCSFDPEVSRWDFQPAGYDPDQRDPCDCPLGLGNEGC